MYIICVGLNFLKIYVKKKKPYCNMLNTEAEMRVQLSSIEPDTNLQKYKTMSFCLLNFLF